MAKRNKNQRLKEPSAREVTASVLNIIGTAADEVFRGHRGDVMVAEHVQLTKIYLTRALELMENKEVIRDLFESGLIGQSGRGPSADDTIH